MGEMNMAGSRKGTSTPLETLIIGDTHFPWQHDGVLDAIIKRIRKTQPKYIVQIGDLYDFYCFSKYMKSLNLMTPEEEVNEGVAAATKFWKRVVKAAPGAKCFQILGNHDIRMRLRVMEKVPAFEHLLNDTKKLWEFNGVKTVHDPREVLELGGVAFTHGYLTNIGDHAKKIGMPTVTGHSHRGGVVTLKEDPDIWELNAGWTADQSQPVFNYRPLKKASFWNMGWGEIMDIDRVKYPRFIKWEEK